MRYRVTGTDRSGRTTGPWWTEATSEASAHRQAECAGISVEQVIPVRFRSKTADLEPLPTEAEPPRVVLDETKQVGEASADKVLVTACCECQICPNRNETFRGAFVVTLIVPEGMSTRQAECPRCGATLHLSVISAEKNTEAARDRAKSDARIAVKLCVGMSLFAFACGAGFVASYQSNDDKGMGLTGFGCIVAGFWAFSAFLNVLGARHLAGLANEPASISVYKTVRNGVEDRGYGREAAHVVTGLRLPDGSAPIAEGATQADRSDEHFSLWLTMLTGAFMGIVAGMAMCFATKWVNSGADLTEQIAGRAALVATILVIGAAILVVFIALDLIAEGIDQAAAWRAFGSGLWHLFGVALTAWVVLSGTTLALLISAGVGILNEWVWTWAVGAGVMCGSGVWVIRYFSLLAPNWLVRFGCYLLLLVTAVGPVVWLVWLVSRVR